MADQSPQHRRNANGAQVDYTLPGWAVIKLFSLQEMRENAPPWERASIQAQIDHLLKVEVPEWEQRHKNAN